MCCVCRHHICCAAETPDVSADKASAVSQDIPMALRRRPQRGRVGNGVGMSWETTDVVSADTTDVLAADTTDVLPADTTHVLPADKFGGRDQTSANIFFRFRTQTWDALCWKPIYRENVPKTLIFSRFGSRPEF